MADFQKILKDTLLSEGGFSNDPDDNGGMTIFGIARTRNPQWAGWRDVDKIIRDNGWNVNNESHWPLIAKACKYLESIESFYRINFWNVIKGDQITSNAVAGSLFDYGVNTGMGTAVKNIQNCLKITSDGSFGPKSLATLNEYIVNGNVYQLLQEFTLRKLLRYVKIVKVDEDQIKYIFGWTSRSFLNLERGYSLDTITEPKFADLYAYVKAGRNNKSLRQDTEKCMYLVKSCLNQYNIV